MHIGVYVNTLPTTVFINRLIGGLVSRNHEVTVFGTGLEPYEKVRGARYAAFKLYSFANYSKLLLFLRYTILLTLFKNREKKRLDARLRSKQEFSRHNQTRFYPILWHQPDVLHVQWVKGIEQFLWVQDFGIKLMTSLRGTHIYLNPVLEPDVALGYKRAFPQLHGVHAVCADLIEEATQYGLDKKLSKVIYSGLKMDDFEFTLPSLKPKSEHLRLISVGRQSWMKGYAYGVDAVALLKNRGLSVQYTVIGGANSEDLLFQINDLGIQNEVKLHGEMPFSEVKKHIKEANVLLLPSVSEGIANTAIEALALGTAVIASHCGGMAELISDGENGFLVPVRNPLAIAEAVVAWHLLALHQKDEMAKKGRSKVEGSFNEELMLAHFESFYTMNQSV
jgi:colanic acid/amylovoran biosynthesis glycosyltransferase